MADTIVPASAPIDDTRFELRFRVDSMDAHALSRHIRWTALERLNALLPALGAGVIGAFLGACLRVWATGRLPTDADVNGVLNWMIVSGLAGLFLFIFAAEPARRRSYAKGRTISMGETVLIAEARAITVTSAGVIVTTFPWSRVAMGESKDHIFFMYSRLEGLVVPKRAFESADQIKRFTAFARSKAAQTN